MKRYLIEIYSAFTCAMSKGLAIAILALPLSDPSTALSATKSWDGSGNNAWGDASNWTPGGVPGNGDDIIYYVSPLPGSGNSAYAGLNNANSGGTQRRANSITFNSTITSAYAIRPEGDRTNIGAGHFLGLGHANPGDGITVNSLADITLHVDVLLRENQTWTVNGSTRRLVSSTNSEIRELNAGTTLTKAGTGTLRLAGNNSYTGLTTVNGGTVEIANGGGDGVIRGDITVNNGGRVELLTSNRIINNSLITINGTGVFDRNGNGDAIGALHGNGSVIGSGSFTLDFDPSGPANFSGSLTGGNLTVRGHNQNGGLANQTLSGVTTIGNLTVNNGNSANDNNLLILGGSGSTSATNVLIGDAGSGTATIRIADTHALNITNNFFLGETANIAGHAQQTGGSVTVGNQFRLGHWPTETSTYNMSGGSLTLTGVPGAGTETAGILYIGIDGTGIFTHSDGDISAAGMVLDNRGATAGTDTYDMTGGSLTLGSSGINVGTGNSTSYQINLGGGTVSASADWTSPLNMSLTGIGGNTTFDTAGNNIGLSGALTGAGNLVKTGDGTLTLTGTGSSYDQLLIQRAPGAGEVSQVTLAGAGSTTVNRVGVGDPVNSAVPCCSGLLGEGVLRIQDTHNLQVNGFFMLGERNGDPGIVRQTGGTVTVANQIRVGHWPNETSVYDMSGGTLNSNGGLFIGWDGTGDMDVAGTAMVNVTAGTFIQRNSTLTIGGDAEFTSNFVGVGHDRGNGFMEIQGDSMVNIGTFSIGDRNGSSGNVQQTGGDVTVSGELRLGHWPNETSIYNMTSGTLTVGNTLSVGWDGIGDMDVSGDAIVDANGGVQIQRGSTLTIGGDADFNSTVIQVGQSRGSGTLQVQGDADVDAMRLDVGNPFGVSGSVEQSGGDITLTGGGGLPSLRLGHWGGETSTYEMTGGVLNTNDVLAVGWDGRGLMTLSNDADVNVDTTLIVQRNSILTISDDSTVNANFFSIGDQRQNGHVDQDGGTVTITGPAGVRLGHWAAGTGSTYDISGSGRLDTTTLAVGWDGDNNTMNVFGNADVNVTGNLLVQSDSLLDVRGSSTVDANFISIGDDRGAGTMNIGENATVTAPDVTVGRTSQGNLNQTGGTLNVTAATTYQVGGGSLGLVAHSGGTANVTGNLNIGTDGTAGDTYTLSNSAVLNFGDTAAVTQVLGPTPSVMTVGPDGDFNFQGGTLINVETINVDPSNSPFTVGDLTVAGGADPTGPARFVIGVDGGLDPNNPATTRAYTTISDGGGTNPDGSPLGTPIDFVLNEDGTLVVDVFGFGSHGINGEQGGSLAINPLDPALDSDILHVTGDATLNGLLEVDLNGFEPLPFAYYDVLLASGQIDDSGLDIDGVHLFRVVDNPFGAGQILQVAVPEPASIAIWTLIGLALAGFGYRRMRK